MTVESIVDVVAAVIRENDRYLITRRGPTQNLSGYWEFPGGKLEPGESPAVALRRELYEELGIEAEIGASLAAINHADGRCPLRLHFLAVTAFTGELNLRVHDASAWVTPAEMSGYPFAPADREFVTRLGRG